VAKLERSKIKYKVDLKEEKNEICELLESYDTQLDALCDFICERHGSELAESTDPALKRVQETVKAHQRRAEHLDESGKRQLCQSQLILDLQAHVDHLKTLNTQQEMKLQTYRGEIELLKEGVAVYKQDEQQHFLELWDKDAQIAALNGKVAQLLTINPTLCPQFLGQRVEKGLPSPTPCDWRRAEELKRQMLSKCTTTPKASSSFPGTVETLDVEDDEGPFPIYKVDI
jgi:hypothetical protein